MSTATTLITSSLRKLGVIASGEDPSSAELADSLVSLNNMIDSFSNESLFIFDDNEETFLLTPSTGSYTMGSGGDFDTVRPVKVTKARLQVNTSSPAFELEIPIYNIDEWANIVQKSNTSTLPIGIYINYGFPLATVNVYPVPSAAQSLILNSMKVVQSFATAATTVSLPPGYERMITYNLAMELAPEYGVEPSPTIQKIAMESKANILRLNTKTPLSSDGLSGLFAGNHFDIYTGR